jgi:hypothetical protein
LNNWEKTVTAKKKAASFPKNAWISGSLSFPWPPCCSESSTIGWNLWKNEFCLHWSFFPFHNFLSLSLLLSSVLSLPLSLLSSTLYPLPLPSLSLSFFLADSHWHVLISKSKRVLLDAASYMLAILIVFIKPREGTNTCEIQGDKIQLFCIHCGRDSVMTGISSCPHFHSNMKANLLYIQHWWI